ncbi:MAG: hypothetical protein ACAI44_13775 [Candidatus Sericytochromatia bacterium]
MDKFGVNPGKKFENCAAVPDQTREACLSRSGLPSGRAVKQQLLILLAGLSLLAGCFHDPGFPFSTGSGAPVAGILPGSKGDRTRLAELEVQLRLPGLDAADFAVKALAVPEDLNKWTAEVDGQQVALQFKASAEAQGELLLSFVLRDVNGSETELQEILLRSSDQVLQAAALIPGLRLGQKRLESPLNSESLAVWLIARKYQMHAGKKLQDLSLADLQQLMALPDVKTLAQSLKELYRQSKGKADPTKSEQITKETSESSDKLAEKIKSNPAPETSTSPKPSSSPKPSTNPNAVSSPKPSSSPKASGKPDLPDSEPDTRNQDAQLNPSIDKH